MLLLSIAGVSRSQQVSIIPSPQQMVVKTGSFTINQQTVLLADQTNANSSRFLNAYLQMAYGFTLKNAPSATTNFIRLSTSKGAGKEEGYSLTCTPSSLLITGNSAGGTFYGVSSLLQLIPADIKAVPVIPCLTITDEPRFAYRGLMLDVSRHFYPVPFVKKFIDNLALFKLNTFHWHLTDDQGWRIEIKRYPKLTSVGGYRDGTIIGHFPGTGNDNMRTGGFYTQEEIKEVVQYAAERFITVIPEIEMPGHASAAIAAYPELSCFPNEPTTLKGPYSTVAMQNLTGSRKKIVQETWGIFQDVYCPSDSTFKFLENVLDEVMPLFPSTYIHIGGDECPKDSWKRSAFCQQLIKDKGLKDEHGLQSYFIQHMEKYLNSKGRKIIGWDEILEGGLAPNATVMSWRGEQGGIDAAKQGHDVVMTPGNYVYFDHSQNQPEDSLTIGGYLPLKQVYGYNPVPAALSPAEAIHVLGAQANLWTEYMSTDAKVEYMLFPRLGALAEVLWTNTAGKNWERFQKQLPDLYKRLETRKVNYSKTYK